MPTVNEYQATKLAKGPQRQAKGSGKLLLAGQDLATITQSIEHYQPAGMSAEQAVSMIVSAYRIASCKSAIDRLTVVVFGVRFDEPQYLGRMRLKHVESVLADDLQRYRIRDEQRFHQ